MAIQGLEREQVTVNNPVEEVGVMVEALERVGLVGDANREAVTASVTADVAALTEGADIVGENYPHVPEGLVTLGEVVNALDTGEFASGKTYRDTYVYDALWTPGADRDGFKASEFGVLVPGEEPADVPAHVRRAVHDPHSPVDPLLHFLNKPFDEKYAEKDEETQLKAIAGAAEEYASAHEGFTLGVLDAKGVAMIALMRRITGQEMPLEEGWMNDASMPRRTVGGDSVVGYVDSHGGRFGLGWSRGRANSRDGVGLSVGPEEFEPQAS